MKLKNIISCFLLAIGLIGNILAVDKERCFEIEEEIHSLIMEKNWIPTNDNIGFFEARGNKAKWNNERINALQKFCDKLSTDQYTYLTITGKMSYMENGFQKISGLNLRNLKILDLDFYFSLFSKEKLDEAQETIEELFKNNHGLKVVFRMSEEISKVFTIK